VSISLNATAGLAGTAACIILGQNGRRKFLKTISSGKVDYGWFVRVNGGSCDMMHIGDIIFNSSSLPLYPIDMTHLMILKRRQKHFPSLRGLLVVLLVLFWLIGELVLCVLATNNICIAEGGRDVQAVAEAFPLMVYL
jgi:hypothetical protein